uniref:Serpentine receptor class r-10 n=1 Tax=Caenorhabditis japonica TaxID=281687 RepID=A0A8R1HMK4_CAEJA
MAAFSIYALVYNYVDIITMPLVLIEKQMYAVVNHGVLRYSDSVGFVFTCIFGSSFGLCISLLSTQFFYRYLAVCRPNILNHLEGRRILLIFVPAACVSIIWFLMCWFGLSMTDEKIEILKKPFLDNFAEESIIPFVGALYWTVDSNGVRRWNTSDCLASVGLALLMFLCSSTIVFCAVNTYKKMHETGNSMSERTKELNKQLFITLSLQTLLPFTLMYCPVGCLFLLPFFEVNIRFLANFAAASTAIYPAVEPLIAMFCIKTFRRALICHRKMFKTTNTIASTANSQSGKVRSNAV